MDDLFVRPDGSPMQFHLADLNKEMETKYTLLIEDSGGRVEPKANEKVLTFTVPAQSLKYDFVFNVEFIDDCIAHRTILDVNKYYLGDERCNRGCLMSKGIMRNSQCLCSTMKYENICEAVRNKMSMGFACLKSTESKDKHTKKHKTTPLKRNPIEELNIERTKKLKQTSLDIPFLDKIKDKQRLSVIIDETDSETEIAPSPVFKKTRAAKNPRRKAIVKHPETAELSTPSTSKEKSDEDSIVILSSDDDADENKLQENVIKNARKGKNVDDAVKTERENGSTEEKNQNDLEKTTNEKKNLQSDELQNFIDGIRKNRRIDKYNYPESSKEKYDDWENQAMLQYLIITGRISEAKDRKVWQHMQKLKVLPRKKTAQQILNHFKRAILPNIDTYNLRPEILAKFQALGPPKKVLEDS